MLDQVDFGIVPDPVPPHDHFSRIMRDIHLQHATNPIDGALEDLVLRASGIAALNAYNAVDGDLDHMHPFPGLEALPTEAAQISDVVLDADRIVTEPWRGEFMAHVNQDVTDAGGYEAYIAAGADHWWRSDSLDDDLPPARAIGSIGFSADDSHRITLAQIFGHRITAQCSAKYVDPSKLAVQPLVDQYDRVTFSAVNADQPQDARTGTTVSTFGAKILLMRGARLLDMELEEASYRDAPPRESRGP